ncbi:Alternative cyclin Pcl12 [Mycena kentingensis (nom. inval.)]|nr:Alternative cyclin Pcl12 [Mycena kentingensis (nom. inval.)]
MNPPLPLLPPQERLVSADKLKHKASFYFVAQICSRFLIHLFGGSDDVWDSPARLPVFIEYLLRRTSLPEDVTYGALILLKRLKDRFPTANGRSIRRLVFCAFCLASKLLDDFSASTKVWGMLGVFTLPEINAMEREICLYLNWDLHIAHARLAQFQQALKVNFGSQTYADFPLPALSQSPAPPRTADLIGPGHNGSSIGTHRCLAFGWQILGESNLLPKEAVSRGSGPRLAMYTHGLEFVHANTALWGSRGQYTVPVLFPASAPSANRQAEFWAAGRWAALSILHRKMAPLPVSPFFVLFVLLGREVFARLPIGLIRELDEDMAKRLEPWASLTPASTLLPENIAISPVGELMVAADYPNFQHLTRSRTIDEHDNDTITVYLSILLGFNDPEHPEVCAYREGFKGAARGVTMAAEKDPILVSAEW